MRNETYFHNPYKNWDLTAYVTPLEHFVDQKPSISDEWYMIWGYTRMGVHQIKAPFSGQKSHGFAMGLGLWVWAYGSGANMGLYIWVLTYGSLHTDPCRRVHAYGSEHLGPHIRVPTSGSQHPGPGIWVPYDFIWHQNCQVRLPGPGIWVPYDLIGLSKLSGPLTGSWDPGPGTRVPCQGTTLL